MIMVMLTRLVLLLLLLTSTWKVVHQLVAFEIAGVSPTVEGLREALSWDSQGSGYYYQLGIIHRDDPKHQDLKLARQFFEGAVQHNPFGWRYWLQLARAYEILNMPTRSEDAYLKAIEINPKRGSYRWRLANFYLRTQEIRKAMPHFEAAIQLNPVEYLQPTLSLLWKTGTSVQSISKIWPQGKEARLILMRFLARTERDEPLLLSKEWSKLIESTNPPTVAEGEFYLRYLLNRDRPQESRRGWIRLAEKNSLHDEDYASGENLIWNGRFQMSITARLFDWDIGIKEEVARTGLDDGLKIEFLGTQNIDLYGLTQLVVVKSGAKFEFSFRARSEGLSTDQGPYLEIEPIELKGIMTDQGPDVRIVPSSVLLESKQLLGTTDWREYSGVFRIPRDRDLVRIRLRRHPSDRIDNKLDGTLWLDSVILREVS